MAAADNRRRCPVCNAASDGSPEGRTLTSYVCPIYWENPLSTVPLEKKQKRARAIRKQNGGGK